MHFQKHHPNNVWGKYRLQRHTDALLYAIQFNFIDDDDYIHNLHKALATLIRCDITNTEQQLKRGDYFSNISRSKQNFDELRDLIMAKDKAEPIYIF